MSTVHVADVVIVRGGRVLLVQQRKPSAFGLWSYLGGHIEPGETADQAVHREVQEELGTQLQHARPLKTYNVPSDDGTRTIVIHSHTGDLAGAINLNTEELLSFQWFTLDELQAASQKLRATVVLEQARDALAMQTGWATCLISVCFLV